MQYHQIKNWWLKLLGLFLIFGLGQDVLSQDIAFSQYRLQASLTNPALLSQDQHIQLGLSYRYQPLDAGGNFSTPIISFIYPFLRKNQRRSRGTLGINLLYDNQADLITESAILTSWAYALGIKRGRLSIGAQLGLFQRNAGNTVFNTDQQFVDRIGLDLSLATGEDFTSLNTIYSTISGGFLWRQLNQQNREKLYFGFSWFNINQPNITFFQGLDQGIHLPAHQTLIAGYTLLDRNNFRIRPNFRWTRRLNTNLVQIGTWIDYPLQAFQNSFKKSVLSIGAWYRNPQALILGIKLDRPQYIMSFSYDLPISNQAPNWLGSGAMEFTWVLKWPRKKKAKPLIPMELIPDQISLDQRLTYLRPILKEPIPPPATPDTLLISNKVIDFQTITLRFNLGQSSIGKAERRNLDYLASLLTNYYNTNIVVTGYTCNLGSQEVNQRISEQRAQRVKNYLVNRGIDARRILVIGAGESKPLVPNNTEKGRQQNRRVEISPSSSQAFFK